MYVLVILEPIVSMEIKSQCDDKPDNPEPNIPTLARRRGAHYHKEWRMGFAVI